MDINEYSTENNWEIIKNQTCPHEFDWFGIDIKGQIAIFSSYNVGYTPDCVTSSLKLHLELENIFPNLKQYTNAIKMTFEDGRYDDWLFYSEKGLYSYNFEYGNRGNGKKTRYAIYFKPEKPLTTNNLNIDKFKDIMPKFNFEFGEDLMFDKMKKELINSQN